MRLQTQPPIWMLHAVLHRQVRIQNAIRPIHWLQKEVLERQIFQSRRIEPLLRKYQLQFASRSLKKRRTSLGANAKPIDPLRRNYSPVRFHRNLKTAGMECVNQRRVQLQQRLTTSADNKLASSRDILIGPFAVNRCRDIRGRIEFPSVLPIHTHKIRIAELASRAGTITLAPRPQIASRKTAEDRSSTSLRALALQGVENLLNAIAHSSIPMQQPKK